MKAITYLLCFSFLMLLACNNEQPADSDNLTNETVTPPALKTETSNSPVNTSPSGKMPTSSEPEKSSDAPAAEIDYTTLANAYCKCAENTVTINDRLAELMVSGDNTAFEALLPEAEKAFKDAMDCCRKAKTKQSAAEVDQQKLFKPLKQKCPDLPKQLMLKMVTEIQ